MFLLDLLVRVASCHNNRCDFTRDSWACEVDDAISASVRRYALPPRTRTEVPFREGYSSDTAPRIYAKISVGSSFDRGLPGIQFPMPSTSRVAKHNISQALAGYLYKNQIPGAQPERC